MVGKRHHTWLPLAANCTLNPFAILAYTIPILPQPPEHFPGIKGEPPSCWRCLESHRSVMPSFVSLPFSGSSPRAIFPSSLFPSFPSSLSFSFNCPPFLLSPFLAQVGFRCTAKDSLQPLFFLPLPLKWQGYRCIPVCLLLCDAGEQVNPWLCAC